MDWKQREQSDVPCVTFYEVLHEMLRVKFEKYFQKQSVDKAMGFEAQSKLIQTVISMFNLKDDKLESHEGGL